MSELKAFSPQNGEKNLKTPRFCDLLKFIESENLWGRDTKQILQLMSNKASNNFVNVNSKGSIDKISRAKWQTLSWKLSLKFCPFPLAHQCVYFGVLLIKYQRKKCPKYTTAPTPKETNENIICWDYIMKIEAFYTISYKSDRRY